MKQPAKTDDRHLKICTEFNKKLEEQGHKIVLYPRRQMLNCAVLAKDRDRFEYWRLNRRCSTGEVRGVKLTREQVKEAWAEHYVWVRESQSRSIKGDTEFAKRARKYWGQM